MFDTPNYNNMNASFNDLKVNVWWSGKENITLAKTDLPPFALAAHNLTTIKSKVTMTGEFNNRTDVINQIVAERGNGSVKIGVSLFGLISLKDGVSEAMKFDFHPVAVKFPAGCKN
ncbi:putative transmembrane protein, partial [Trifolium medium]|nr:putative transmembrane protein [Trifolium medium]